MNKHKILLLIGSIILSNYCVAQNIDLILNRIEKNNKEIKMIRQLEISNKAQLKIVNNLRNPEISYARLWDSKTNETNSEMVVSQSFDFPTLYLFRTKLNKLKSKSIEHTMNALRQDVLLKAKKICIDIIIIHQQNKLLKEQLSNIESLNKAYQKRLDSGDANIIELNKIKVELLNIKTKYRLNTIELSKKEKELSKLNGDQPIQLMNYELPMLPSLEEYDISKNKYFAKEARIIASQQNSIVARKEIGISKQGWLPNINMGYRRNTEGKNYLNGFVVGLSIPLFANHNKVKIAKANFGYKKMEEENLRLEAETTFNNLFDEAKELKSAINNYQTSLASLTDISILKKALNSGELSIIEYFIEQNSIYQCQENYLNLINQYHKIFADLKKGEL